MIVKTGWTQQQHKYSHISLLHYNVTSHTEFGSNFGRALRREQLPGMSKPKRRRIVVTGKGSLGSLRTTAAKMFCRIGDFIQAPFRRQHRGTLVTARLPDHLPRSG